MKAPKIENSPMTFVIAAEKKMSISKNAKVESEISRHQHATFFRPRQNSRRATKIMKRAQASASAIIVIVAKGLKARTYDRTHQGQDETAPRVVRGRRRYRQRARRMRLN
jgi:hypothetical protein